MSFCQYIVNIFLVENVKVYVETKFGACVSVNFQFYVFSFSIAYGNRLGIEFFNFMASTSFG
jgi:hypothetical protein